MEDRKVAFTSRVSLADAQEGWTDECYVIVTKATALEKNELIDQAQSDNKDDRTNVESAQAMIGIVKKHFVSGKIMVVGYTHPVDMEEADIDQLTSDALFDVWAAIVGYKLDPKDSGTTTETSSTDQSEPQNAQSATSEPSATTSSSTQ